MSAERRVTAPVVDTPNAATPPRVAAGIVAFATSRLHVLAPDGVVTRADLLALGEAADVLACARLEAGRIVQDAQAAAAALRGDVESEGRLQLQALEQDLRARMAVAHAAWLAELAPACVEAVEQALRRLCTQQLGGHVLAGALEAAAAHFESLAGVRMGVHPDDAEHARSALALLDLPAGAVRLQTDPELAPGSCRLRGRELELRFDLDRAIDLVIGKA